MNNLKLAVAAAVLTWGTFTGIAVSAFTGNLPQGNSGSVGPSGESGIQGVVGSTGVTGAKGSTGDRGLRGGKGPMGLCHNPPLFIPGDYDCSVVKHENDVERICGGGETSNPRYKELCGSETLD